MVHVVPNMAVSTIFTGLLNQIKCKESMHLYIALVSAQWGTYIAV